MEIKHLSTFKAVADNLSFHRAARSLHYAQSTVSAQIMALEEELGVRLFDRLGRRILLTPAGETLYKYSAKMLDLQNAARAELTDQSETTGSLTIRVPDSLCVHRLPPVVALFRERLPRVRINFITCAQEGLKRDLQKGVTDLAFLLADSIYSADFSVEALGTEELVVLASPEHALARAGQVGTADLAQWPLLVSRVDCSYRRMLTGVMDRQGTQARVLLELNSVAAVISHARQGLGWTMLPRVAAAEELNRGRLALLAWDEGFLEVACLMIWRKNRWLSPALLGFMEAARQILYQPSP